MASCFREEATMTLTVARHPATEAGAATALPGLHGHRLGTNIARVAAAETLGTFVLVLTIVCTAIAANLVAPVAGAPYGSLAVALAGGLALASAVAGLGPVSGAHLNPAVTVGLALNRRFPWAYVPAYVAAQFVGAIGAALVAWVLYGDKARTVANLGATTPAEGLNAWRTFGAEAVVTFLLVSVIVLVALNPRVPPGVAAMAIGFALTAAILIGGPITGAGVNPARAIGTMIPAGEFTDWWAYLFGPLLGGATAASLYDRVFRYATQPA
jgi:MIP family channel proteins